MAPAGKAPLVEFQRFSERKHWKPHASPELLKRIKLAPLGVVNGYRNWLVDSELVRDVLDADFCMGSHFAHSAFIPMGEVWLCSLLSPTDLTALIVHEAVETHWMTKNHWSYEKAHDRATMFEREIRKRIRSGAIKIPTKKAALLAGQRLVKEILVGDKPSR
jgi:hypothetical protein